MITTGLVSISFRSLTAEEVVQLVKKAGLASIEWGGDIHVPPGDIETAKKVAQLTQEAGLVTSAYGSYYRAGSYEEPEKEAQAVVDSALSLNTTLIRIWAGTKGTQEATQQDWDAVVAQSKLLVALAAPHGIQVAFEYHGNTLTDTLETTVKLLDEVPGSLSYWQPPVGSGVEENIKAIERIQDRLANIHVFHWKERERLPLSQGRERWEKYFAILNKVSGHRYASLEFVKDGSTDQLLLDAKVLQELLGK